MLILLYYCSLYTREVLLRRKPQWIVKVIDQNKWKNCSWKVNEEQSPYDNETIEFKYFVKIK